MSIVICVIHHNGYKQIHLGEINVGIIVMQVIMDVPLIDCVGIVMIHVPHVQHLMVQQFVLHVRLVHFWKDLLV